MLGSWLGVQTARLFKKEKMLGKETWFWHQTDVDFHLPAV